MAKNEVVEVFNFETDKNYKLDAIISILTEAKKRGCNKLNFTGGDYEDGNPNVEVILFGKKKKVIVNTSLKSVVADVYDPEDNKIGEVRNHLQLNDVRLQIKRAKVKGYYFLFKGQKVVIDDEGDISDWPTGFFDIIDGQLQELVGF